MVLHPLLRKVQSWKCACHGEGIWLWCGFDQQRLATARTVDDRTHQLGWCLEALAATWAHSNCNWTLGPLRYIFVTPVFHRGHHSSPEEGGNSNFATTFSFWDLVFGTFYMPEGKLPQTFGIDDHHFPKSYFAQLVYPFRLQGKDQIITERLETVPTS